MVGESRCVGSPASRQTNRCRGTPGRRGRAEVTRHHPRWRDVGPGVQAERQLPQSVGRVLLEVRPGRSRKQHHVEQRSVVERQRKRRDLRQRGHHSGEWRSGRYQWHATRRRRAEHAQRDEYARRHTFRSRMGKHVPVGRHLHAQDRPELLQCREHADVAGTSIRLRQSPRHRLQADHRKWLQPLLDPRLERPIADLSGHGCDGVGARRSYRSRVDRGHAQVRPDRTEPSGGVFRFPAQL